MAFDAFLDDGESGVFFGPDPEADKLQIGRAVEELFKVRVLNVRTFNVRGKMKRLGRFTGKRAATKKAYVRIHPEGHIDLFEKI